VPAGRRALDDEPIDPPVGLARQHGGQAVGCDDREEEGASECAGYPLGPVLRRVEGEVFRFVARETVHIQPDGGGAVLGEPVEGAGDLLGDPGAHQDVIDAAEHGPVEGAEVRHLHLGEEVDPHHPVVPFLGEENLAEVGRHGELVPDTTHHLLVHGNGLVGDTGLAASREEVALEDVGGHLREREVLHGAPQVSTLVAVLEAPYEEGVERRSGNDAELPPNGDGAGEDPVRYAHPHTALDDGGVREAARHASSCLVG
jgi:hypothetical protein